MNKIKVYKDQNMNMWMVDSVHGIFGFNRYETALSCAIIMARKLNDRK